MTGTEPTAPDVADQPGADRGPVVPTPRDAPAGDAARATPGWAAPAGRSGQVDRAGQADRAPDGGSGLAWLVRPVTHVPGVLHLREGRLRFVSTRGVIFDDTLESLAVAPARTSRGGFRVTVGDERLRLHVVRFAGAVEIPTDLRSREAAGDLLTAGEPAAGTVWRRLIAAPAATPSVGVSKRPRRQETRPVRDRGWRPVRFRRACATPAPWY